MTSRRRLSITVVIILLAIPVGVWLACKPKASINSASVKNDSNQLSGQTCPATGDTLLRSIASNRGYDAQGQLIGYHTVGDEAVTNLCESNQTGMDPVCSAYCETCAPHGPHADIAHLLHELAIPVKLARVFEAIGVARAEHLLTLDWFGKFAIGFGAAAEQGLLHKPLHHFESALCLTAFYDMAKILATLDHENLGRPAERKVVDAICAINLAIQTCEAMPVIGPAIAPVRHGMHKIPAVAAVSVGVALACPVGQIIADQLIQCPAFKAGCRASLQAARPISNGECCVCGYAVTGSGQGMSTILGGRIYDGPETCQNLSDTEVRRQFTVPERARAFCEAVAVDPNKTASCSFGKVVYGANISCGRDNGTHCLPASIYTRDGREIPPPAKPSPALGCESWTSMSEIKRISSGNQRPSTVQSDFSTWKQ